MNDRKKLFLKGWSSGLTKREAAIQAGYSEKTASQQGAALSKDPEVLQALALTRQVSPGQGAAPMPIGLNTDLFAETVQSMARPVSLKSDKKLPDSKRESVDLESVEFAPNAVLISDIADTEDPKEVLISVMRNPHIDAKMRMDAAKTLMPFVHVKMGEGGKKDQKQTAAEKAVQGKYAPTQPPRLVANSSAH